MGLLGGSDADSDDGKNEIFGPTCKILVKKATNLKNKVKFGTIDPYCEVTFENHTKKTKVIDDEKNPEWNEELVFPRGNSDTVKVQVKVYHEESIGSDKLLAQGTGTISNYMQSEWHDIEIKLIDAKQRATDGIVSLGVGGGGGGDGEGDEEDGEYDEEDVEDESSGGGGGGGGGGAPGKPGGKKKKKKKKGSNEVSAAVEAARAKINFSALSTKEETFQIRFVVHKARKLSSYVETPMVRVTMNGKSMRTQTRKGLNPKYNETVMFSITKSEKDLLDLPIELSVVDSSKDQTSNLIGLYNFDLTVAWAEKDHLLQYKWFALNDPDEPHEGLTGYVNVSIQVITPGKSPKKLPKKSDTEIDVSTNVFYPPGMSLQPGQFIIRIYSGEDIPQMDSAALASVRNLFSSGEKPPDLVDPYAVFEFAGSTIESETRYGTFDPVYEQKLVIHGEFPSMAENVVIRLKDKDDYEIDDLIATKLLNISEISFSSTDSDMGFLPTFGPAYIPLYGSLREHQEIRDKYEKLNEGDEEGIAYRGRVLISIDSNMGEPEADLKTKSNLKEEETAEVMSKLRRHKYHLFTSFDTGNMIRETDNQVEFEVSIGDYGNSLSLVGSTYPSTTQPCNAVYDGTHYHFMPWSSSKPTVILHSQWEDIEFRAETLNLLNWLTEYMEDQLRSYKVLDRARGTEEHLDAKCNEVVGNILEQFAMLEIPKLPENANKLDHKLNKIRLFQLGKLPKEPEKKEEFEGIDITNPTEVVIDIDEEHGEEVVDEPSEGEEEEQLLKDVLDVNEKPKKKENVLADNLFEELQAILSGRFQHDRRVDKVKRIESVLAKLKDLCFDPQISIPDVFIWMMSGTTRIAYTRIPINEIIYTENPKGRGKLCGGQGSFFLKKPRKETIGAHLSMTIWFGKFEHVSRAFKTPHGSDVTVYAETYENQWSTALTGWTTKLLPRPKFSDITGKYEIPKESFEPPPGWRFHDDWQVSIDKSLLVDNEQGLTVFREAVFEGQTRKPGADWNNSSIETWWKDEKGDDGAEKDKIECREGWQWTGDWVVDTKRGVDHEGYEYADEADSGNFGPVERNYHLARRRLWVRVRERVGEIKTKEYDGDPEGWEYSKLFTTKFHPKERTFDMVRRRRWNRKLVSDIPVPVVFSVLKDPDDKDKENPEKFNIAPRVMTEFNSSNVQKYQLRAYLYQARGLLGADPTGYSDPYARIIFGNRSGCTRTLQQTCSPLWDTTIILDNIEICGLIEEIENNPPHIVIEMFDEDVLNHDKLGRVVCKPRVMLKGYDNSKLQWFDISGVKKSKGELLAAFELYKLGENELPLPPPINDQRYQVPFNIRPELIRTRVEILSWGLRQLKEYKLLPVDSPHVEIEIGGETLCLDKIKSVKQHSNFDNPTNFIDVMLPSEDLYMPPINIRILDNRSFGYTPLVGVATIKEYGHYRTSYEALKDSYKELKKQEQLLELEGSSPGDSPIDDNVYADVDLSSPSPESEQKVSHEADSSQLDVQKTDGVEIIVIEDEDPNGKAGKHPDIKNKNKSQSMEKLISNEEIGQASAADKKPKELPKQKTRAEIKQERQEEATKKANPDDILVSDWWSKYYECVGNDPRLKKIFDERDLPRIKLFDRNLEDYYENFQDIMESIPLVKPDNDISSDDNSDSDEEDIEARHRVGYFKGSIKVYEISEEMYQKNKTEKPQLLFANLPTNKKADVLVRVYVVAAMGLTPLDFGGSVDPYLVVKCGKTTIEDKSKYLTKELNPIFGRVFQIRAKLPRDAELTIKVMDHDIIGANDLVGSTTIDIENRFLSWRRASCGLAQQYITKRGNKDKWRDQLKPTDILKRVCALKGWPKPEFKHDEDGLKVIVGGREYSPKTKRKGPLVLNSGGDNKQPVNKSTEKHELALEVLHELDAVPEHIETRTLTNEDCPGIPQGKIHLWVDIFPYSDNIPPPLNIAPRVPQKYVLRCIIWNTEDVILDETNVLGESMSDIYLKCFLEGRKKDSQETDVHYRSLTGEGNFNWRMYWDLDFIVQENKMIQKKKAKFWHIEKSVKKVDPIFHVKVYDKDVLSRDDLLGWTELDITRLPAPTKTAKECSLEQYENEKKHPRMSLFEKKKIKGFWPVFDDSLDGTRELTGKVEMELEILTEQEAIEKPAGKAREEPNLNPTLEPPNRPDTSFNWFTNPWKLFTVIIWRRYKWHIIIGLIIILLVLFAVLMFYSAPAAINQAIYN